LHFIGGAVLADEDKIVAPDVALDMLGKGIKVSVEIEREYADVLLPCVVVPGDGDVEVAA
jgi:hypothetical protein